MECLHNPLKYDVESFDRIDPLIYIESSSLQYKGVTQYCQIATSSVAPLLRQNRVSSISHFGVGGFTITGVLSITGPLV